MSDLDKVHRFEFGEKCLDCGALIRSSIGVPCRAAPEVEPVSSEYTRSASDARLLLSLKGEVDALHEERALYGSVVHVQTETPGAAMKELERLCNEARELANENARKHGLARDFWLKSKAERDEAVAELTTLRAQNKELRGALTFDALRTADAARQKEWDREGHIDAAYRGNELAGEVGEACNVIKKLERERRGIKGSRAVVEDLARELADVIICADLVAAHYGIDLGRAVAAKFNLTSEQNGLSTRLAALGDEVKNG